jgi:hypothetical protein
MDKKEKHAKLTSLILNLRACEIMANNLYHEVSFDQKFMLKKYIKGIKPIWDRFEKDISEREMAAIDSPEMFFYETMESHSEFLLTGKHDAVRIVLEDEESENE